LIHKILEKLVDLKSFVGPLKLIFDKSLKTGEVPTEWKEANVAPLFKKGSKLERSITGQYRLPQPYVKF
jgi:hypothetical protein